MKLKIKVKPLFNGCPPVISEKGDWLDLRCNEEIILKKGQQKLIPLGVAIEMPKGFEGYLLPRSSTFKSYGIIVANNMGIIDNSYCGNNDQWMLNVIAVRTTRIPKDLRICQFRIQLSQKATVLQKLKWLFSNGIEVKIVDFLTGKDRQGFGSTGK